MSFQKVASIEDLWSGEMLGLEVNGRRVLLVNIDNHVYAHVDACPHQDSRLSEGTIADRILRCSRHHWEFDVCSGVGVNPRSARLTPLSVRLEGDDILMDVDAAEGQGTITQGERDR